MADQENAIPEEETPIAVPTGDDVKKENGDSVPTEENMNKENGESKNEEQEEKEVNGESKGEDQEEKVPEEKTEEEKVEDSVEKNDDGGEEVAKQQEEQDGEKEQPATDTEASKTEQEKPAEDTDAEPVKEDSTPAAEKTTEESDEKVEAQRSPSPDKPETHAPASTPMENTGVTTEPTEEKHEVDSHAPSPEPTAFSFDATATVKFVLMPSGQVATLAFSLGQTLQQLKDHFAQELKMPSNVILLLHEGKSMSSEMTLADLGVGPNGTVQLELQSADPVNTPIKPYRPRQEYHMPDVITVRVQSDDDTFNDVVVEIERTTKKKPYLGGYRHKKNGVEYHHAAVQTMQKQRPPPAVPRFCRDTQTVQQRHRVQQTTNDMSTQMTKIGVYVANVEDKLLCPGKYITADDHLHMVLRKVLIIQKYYRRWLAKRYVQRLKEDKKQRQEFERQEELRKIKEKEDRIKKEFERRMNPKSKEDFDLLYHALEKWKLEEENRINSELTGAERKAALCMLLDQETQLIAAIGRHKLEADDENKDKRVLAFLSKAASPKKWKTSDGKTTEMDTPYTIRAKELRDIYNSINMKYLTQDERLDVLLTLKHTVKEHDCKLTQEIIELIDREADLLMRGVKEGNLEGLRKRISTLFLQYIKTPTFNPEAAKLLSVPQDPSTLRKNIYFCPSCSSYLPSTEFSLASNSKTVGKCRRCAKIDNDARTRQDFSIYKNMLKSLRRAEENYADGSQIAFLLQESDILYLVDKIWNSQSILSAWDDLYDLTIVRWDKHDEWSPWNCIFLTKDEAQAHEKLASLDEGYGQVFIHKIKQKHTLARNYFSRLPGMAELIRAKANQKEMLSGPKVAGRAMSVKPKSAQPVS